MRKPKPPSTTADLESHLAHLSVVNRELTDINKQLLDIAEQWRDMIDTLLTLQAAEGSKWAAKTLLQVRMARTRATRGSHA